MTKQGITLKLDSFNISNLLQLFTSTAKSQRKLILQRARLCKLCRSSNINSTIPAYNFSNDIFLAKSEPKEQDMETASESLAKCTTQSEKVPQGTALTATRPN